MAKSLGYLLVAVGVNPGAGVTLQFCTIAHSDYIVPQALRAGKAFENRGCDRSFQPLLFERSSLLKRAYGKSSETGLEQVFGNGPPGSLRHVAWRKKLLNSQL